MRIAIPIWQSRVSPVFDAARRLLIVDVEEGRETARTEETISEISPPRKARRLRELGVDVLICGAVSRPLAALIAQSGVRVVPWIAGDVEEVLKYYIDGRMPDPRFLMPGCGRYWGRGGRRHGRGWAAAGAAPPGPPEPQTPPLWPPPWGLGPDPKAGPNSSQGRN